MLFAGSAATAGCGLDTVGVTPGKRNGSSEWLGVFLFVFPPPVNHRSINRGKPVN